MVLVEIVPRPLMRGTIIPETATGYTYAVEVLEANRDFIIAEVHAYIAVTYPVTTILLRFVQEM